MFNSGKHSTPHQRQQYQHNAGISEFDCFYNLFIKCADSVQAKYIYPRFYLEKQTLEIKYVTKSKI